MRAPHARQPTDQKRVAPRRAGAFTLVELLVVLAIVGVLLALTLGAVRMGMHASRRAVCANNLRWLHQGVIDYTNDHRGMLPAARRQYSLYLEYEEPLASLAPYFDVPVPFYDENDEVVTGQPWECPGDRRTAAAHGSNYQYYPYHGIMAADGVAPVSRYYHEFPSLAILWTDVGRPHPGGPRSSITGKKENYMIARFDGAVGWWAELAPQ
ncbi:MAG: type II secretion system protein [Phycisphaerales bacterium]|nr:MAG: type II secretion system protein [Phycisphaerales bacterium]